MQLRSLERQMPDRPAAGDFLQEPRGLIEYRAEVERIDPCAG